MNNNPTTLNTSYTSTKTTVVQLVNYTIFDVNLVPKTNARIMVYFDDISGVRYSRNFTISGTDYANWGTDDSYLDTYIITNISTIFSSS